MRSPRGFLINRDFARLWTGQAISTVGDYVFDTTVVLWVATVVAKGRPWAPAAVSGVLLSVGAAVLLGVVAVFNPINELAYMLSAVVAGWLGGTGLAGFRASVGAVRFGPIDTIFAASGLLIILAGCYAATALPRDTAPEPVPVRASA